MKYDGDVRFMSCMTLGLDVNYRIEDGLFNRAEANDKWPRTEELWDVITRWPELF